ncbi:MAG: DUF2914 domain-containing protein [Geobacteraceae bacterium]|nr:DUF2914 domain-containing protein [Geobacteraceae bacterium]
MRHLVYTCLFIALFFLLPCQVLAQEGSLTVADMSITTRIVRGNPVDSVQRISSSSIHELYCYTKVTASEDAERQIVHEWYRNDEMVSRCVLPVQGTSWRTYSKKLITTDMAGDWRVDVLDSAGNLLKTTKFILN